MDFTLTDEQRMLVKTIRRFVYDELIPLGATAWVRLAEKWLAAR